MIKLLPFTFICQQINSRVFSMWTVLAPQRIIWTFGGRERVQNPHWRQTVAIMSDALHAHLRRRRRRRRWLSALLLLPVGCPCRAARPTAHIRSRQPYTARNAARSERVSQSDLLGDREANENEERIQGRRTRTDGRCEWGRTV